MHNSKRLGWLLAGLSVLAYPAPDSYAANCAATLTIRADVREHMTVQVDEYGRITEISKGGNTIPAQIRVEGNQPGADESSIRRQIYEIWPSIAGKNGRSAYRASYPAGPPEKAPSGLASPGGRSILWDSGSISANSANKAIEEKYRMMPEEGSFSVTIVPEEFGGILVEKK